ncbi:MAG: hypothetical protein NT005_16080, partial [Spirochaetes bacterium]|nr:hypothetical protein [Spirochaetota bacterium]
LPKAGPQQLFAHFTELECLDEPLLGGHGAKNAKVQSMVRALLRVHLLILLQCYLYAFGRVNGDKSRRSTTRRRRKNRRGSRGGGAERMIDGFIAS